MKLDDNYENAILQAKHGGGSILCGILLNALVYLEVGIKRNITHHKTTTSYGSLFLTFCRVLPLVNPKSAHKNTDTPVVLCWSLRIELT